MNYEILPEEFGGDVQCALVSAKQGLGVEQLLEKILVQVHLLICVLYLSIYVCTIYVCLCLFVDMG